MTLDDVRRHTKASSSCGSCTGLVEQIFLPLPLAPTTRRPEDEAAAVCMHRSHACRSPAGDSRVEAAVDYRRDARARLACRALLRNVPAWSTIT